MRLAHFLSAVLMTAALTAGSVARAEPPLESVDKVATGTSAPQRPIVGIPAPSDRAITGSAAGLAPSEQLAGRQAALRFRFQQQMQTGDRPWLPRTRPE